MVDMHISWVRYHGRSAELSKALNIEAVFLPDEIMRMPTLKKYMAGLAYTWAILRTRRPKTIIVMLPPAPALLAVRLFKGRHVRLIGDLHTGFFSDKKWSWFTAIGLRALRGSTAIVTNSYLADRCRVAGVEAVVLHDVLVDRRGAPLRPNGSFILCPLSYANDEPIRPLLLAAALTPESCYVLTGDAPAWVRDEAPANVEFTGYVDDATYSRLLGDCLAVIAITTRDFTMQRAGYEALMFGKPQITSNFPVLREFLEDAAIYVDPESGWQLADAVAAIAKESDRFQKQVERVLDARIRDQDDSLRALAARMS